MINFPQNPAAGQVYTFGAKSWKWNGRAWDLQTISDVQVQRAEAAAIEAANQLTRLRVADYAGLRALTADVTAVYVSGYLATTAPAGIAGVFVRDDTDTTTADNGGTVIVATNGKRWKRAFTGPASVKWFGAIGNGVAVDRAAINAAFAAHRNVLFEAGTYNVGPLGPGEIAVDLSTYGAGITIKTAGEVRIICTTTGAGASIPIFFNLQNNSHFSCDDIEFQDLGYIAGDPWHGAFGFFLSTQAGQNWGNLRFGKIYGKNILCPLGAAGVVSATDRLRGIHIKQIFSDDCYYGVNFQNQGDGVKIDQLVAYQNFRPFYVYGVSDHEVKIYNRKNRGTSGAVNISRSVGGLNTSDIKVSYVARDMDVTITHVLINHIDLLGGEISGIEIDLDIRSSIIYAPLRFVNYTGSGGAETAAASANRVYDVTLRGSCDGQALQVTSVATYAQKGQLEFNHGLNFSPDQTIFDKFLFGRTLRNYGVTWTAASGGAPAIGNGQLTADIDLVNGVAMTNIRFIPGSTTNFGGSQWLFGLPFKATCARVGSVWILDSGNAYFIGVAKIEPGDSTVQVFTNNAGLSVGSAVPMAWQNGDQMYVSIDYPVS